MVPFVVPDVLKYVEHPADFPRRTAPRSGVTPRCGFRGRSGRPTATAWCSPSQYESMAAHVRRVERLAVAHRALGHGLPVRRLARPHRAAGRAARGQGGRRRGGHRLPVPQRRTRRRSGRDPRPGRRTPPTTPNSPIGPGAPSTSTTSADDGTIHSDAATVYALAIVFGLLDDRASGIAGERLAELVAEGATTSRPASPARRSSPMPSPGPATSTTPTGCCCSTSARRGSTRSRWGPRRSGSAGTRCCRTARSTLAR